jgi:hypothetical protein
MASEGDAKDNRPYIWEFLARAKIQVKSGLQAGTITSGTSKMQWWRGMKFLHRGALYRLGAPLQTAVLNGLEVLWRVDI